VVNGQIEVHILIQAPLILGVIVLLPQLIPMLYSSDFEPALKMTQIAMFALLLNTVTYPLSFLPLSKGDSFTFLVQESIYNISFVVFIVFGYSQYGLSGVGVAMAMARLIDLVSASLIAHYKYSFRFSSRVKMYFFIHSMIYVVAAFAVFIMKGHYNRLLVSAACVACSVLISLYMLSVHGNFLYKLYQRIFKRK
jgi:O-antigen/teichoic acid export membrane protein